MNIRKTVLAAAIAAFAFAALPALASANPTLDFKGSTHFTISGGPGELVTAEDKVTCSSVTGTGEFTNGETGTIEFTFHGCKEELGFNCTSSGQSTGTITTEELTFHLVTATEAGKAAVLITPNENGHFATFNCFIISVTVAGNGIIGELTKPNYEEESDEFEVVFTETEGKQAPMTVIGSETEYDLESTIGESTETAIEIASGTGTFTNGDKAILTHTP